MRLFVALFSILALAGCRSGSIASPAPAAPQLLGMVTINTPASGALIYAEVLQIAGTATGLPANQFLLTLVGPDEVELARSIISVNEGRWQVELPHTYQDVPIEVAITAKSPDPNISTPYAVGLIALGGLDYRPEGTYGYITFPPAGSSVGGDSVQVEGLASGLPDNRLAVRLRDTDLQIINEQIVSIYNPYFVDEMPWTAEVATNNYTGPASLEILQDNDTILSSITLNLETAAG